MFMLASAFIDYFWEDILKRTNIELFKSTFHLKGLKHKISPWLSNLKSTCRYFSGRHVWAILEHLDIFCLAAASYGSVVRMFSSG